MFLRDPGGTVESIYENNIHEIVWFEEMNEE